MPTIITPETVTKTTIEIYEIGQLTNCPLEIANMREFEEDLHKMIKNIKIKNSKKNQKNSKFQQQLKQDFEGSSHSF